MLQPRWRTRNERPHLANMVVGTTFCLVGFMVMCAVGCAHRQPSTPLEEPPPPEPVERHNDPFDLDITFCFDYSRSMAQWISPITRGARTIDADLREVFVSRNIDVRDIRVRAIAFSDIYVEGDRSLLSSPFCTLPDDEDLYYRYVASFRPRSGGDDPESVNTHFTMTTRFRPFSLAL